MRRDARRGSARSSATVVCVLVMLLVAGCTAGSGSRQSTSSGPRPASAAARAYLNAALAIMQHHALNRYRLNWPLIRRQAFRDMNGAVTAADTHPAIKLALSYLDVNGHSGRYTRAELDSYNVEAGLPTGQMVTPAISYLALPGNPGAPTADRRYIIAGERLFQAAEAHHACGWIVDLRSDFGGGIYPMLLATQPLLGSHTVGYFVPPRAARLPVTISPTTARSHGYTVRAPIPDRHDLSQLPVAVLTGRHTASAAEFMVIAFHGRPDTRFFGAPTAGVPTANKIYRLSDGALLVLTEAQEADRTGHLYPDAPIAPEQAINNAATTASATDPATHAAEHWIENQASCH